MKYQVYDGGKPADSKHHVYINKGHGWDNSIFNTLEDAKDYAYNWFVSYISLNEIKDMVPNEKYDYSGYGDCAEIKEIVE